MYHAQLGRMLAWMATTEITTPEEAKDACSKAIETSPNRQTTPLPPFTSGMNAKRKKMCLILFTLVIESEMWTSTLEAGAVRRH